MKLEDINIRDPFVLNDGGVYYLYGTRAKDFGCHTGGFDVYTSTDLVNWSEPKECFNSAEYGLNREVNWAPEVHKYKGEYYMLATFTQENGLRGSYVLKRKIRSVCLNRTATERSLPKNGNVLTPRFMFQNQASLILFFATSIRK